MELNLFFGRQPSDDFLEDLEALKKLSEKEVFELVDKVIEWYPKEEDVSKEVEEWLKKFGKKEKEKRSGLMEALAFVFRMFASGNVDENELREDIKKIDFPGKYFDYFLKKLSKEKEFHKKAIRQRQPHRNFLSSVDWRIDKQGNGEEFSENVCVIDLTYYFKGKEETAQFSLSQDALKNLIFTLNKIEKKLCHLNKNT